VWAGKKLIGSRNLGNAGSYFLLGPVDLGIRGGRVGEKRVRNSEWQFGNGSSAELLGKSIRSW
jgi:hypothetical protein